MHHQAERSPCYYLPLDAQVLVVDNARVSRALIADHVRALGLEVAAAPSLDDAMAALREARCSLVIVDVGLPAAPAIEFARTLGALAGRSRCC